MNEGRKGQVTKGLTKGPKHLGVKKPNIREIWAELGRKKNNLSVMA